MAEIIAKHRDALLAALKAKTCLTVPVTFLGKKDFNAFVKAIDKEEYAGIGLVGGAEPAGIWTGHIVVCSRLSSGSHAPCENCMHTFQTAIESALSSTNSAGSA